MPGAPRSIDAAAMVASFRLRASELLSGIGTDLSISCDPDPPTAGVFLAEAVAETPGAVVRIIYGDRELEVRTSIHPSGRPWPLELSFYLDAMGEDATDVRDAKWVDTRERLERVLTCQAGALKACLRALTPDPVPLWRAADARRLASIADSRETLRREERGTASRRSADERDD